MAYDPSYLHLVFPRVQFHALLYGRNSDDPMKAGRSVEDQLVTGRALCRDHNWKIAHEFKDTGISASRHGTKSRDDFEELLHVIEHGVTPPGVIRVCIAFEASRYYRDLEAYVRLRKACLNANVLLCYNGVVYDLSRRDDRKATAQHAIDAEDEAEAIRDRNLRTTQLQAEAGAPHGKLIFGYCRKHAFVGGRQRCIGQEEDPVAGPYVVQSLERIDSGQSLKSLVRWLRSEDGAARHDGVVWNEELARRMLLNRAYLGERLHHGVVHKATWEPIKGLETPQGRAMFNRVADKLMDPQRTTQRGTEVAHLLSLIALCGVCGDHAVMSARRSSKSGRWNLTCREAQNVSVSEDLADAFVEQAVIAWFRDKQKAMAALVPESDEVEQKMAAAQRLINAYEEQLAEARALAEEFDDETGQFRLSAASLARMEQRLLPKLEAERKRLRSFTGVSPLLLSLLNADDPAAVWYGHGDEEDEDVAAAGLGLTLDQKREVIRKVVSVRIHQARKQGVRRLEPGRITLAFAGEPGFRARPLRAPESARG